MKHRFWNLFRSLLLFWVLFTALPVFAQSTGGVGAIINHHAARNFIAGSLSREDLDRILHAGIRAPSANNRQPWHFTVVQNQSLARRIIPNLTEGNVLIVISGEGDGVSNGRIILDCALAVESLYLAAQALGYGSRIYTGPIEALNRSLKGELGLPQGHSAVAIVRVGRLAPGTDGVSAASSRREAAGTVTWK
ncbi:MAG: nitroreductase family protein [Spirochaetales bacterium]|nr:nitroreductase family protein [Spirochaetales bacterium]